MLSARRAGAEPAPQPINLNTGDAHAERVQGSWCAATSSTWRSASSSVPRSAKSSNPGEGRDHAADRLRSARSISHLFLVIKQGAQAGPYLSVEAAQKAGAVTFNYGMFLNTVISFVIIAFAVFLLIRAINRLKMQEEKKPAATPEDVVLLREIRDSLKKR
jgi:large-conductance mechanosensitive channel